MSLSVYPGRSLMWPSRGLWISTFGTSPSRRNERDVPSAIASAIVKSSERITRPSTFCPPRNVTVAVMGVAPPPRPLRGACKTGPDSAEIPRCGVTAGALRFEISTAGAGVAHQHIERERRSRRRRTLTSGGSEDAMDVLRNRAHVVRGEIDCGHWRHSGVPSSFADHHLD